jgi:O-succinylbenzoic acid--CoA ligase
MQISREAMVSSARRTLEFFNLQAGDRVLHCLPMEYIAGKMMVVRALVGGLDLYLARPSSRPLEQVRDRFRFAAMVPLQFQSSLEAGDDLGRIDILLLGGAESSPELQKRLMDPGMPALYESFGMAETCSHFALRRLNGTEATTHFLALEGVKLSTDDRDCLVVEVEGVTMSPVITNDMAALSEDAVSFRWLGRIDNVINTGGIKVNPESLEEEISRILGVGCLVFGRSDPRLGERLVLLAESGDKEVPGNWDTLLKKTLAPHLRPREIILVPEIPRNASFKPDRMKAAELLDRNS